MNFIISLLTFGLFGSARDEDKKGNSVRARELGITARASLSLDRASSASTPAPRTSLSPTIPFKPRNDRPPRAAGLGMSTLDYLGLREHGNYMSKV